MRTLTKVVFLAVVIAVISTACVVPARLRVIRGSGDVIVEDRDVSGFDRISISGAGKIILTQGDRESLTIETDDNLMEYIETRVVGDTLEIDFTDEIVLSPGGRDVLEPSDGFIFRISVIDLEAIKVSGAADIQTGKLKTDRLVITFSGAGDISINDLNADTLEVYISGAGNVDLAGKVLYQYVTLSGVGRYAGFGLESQEASVTISGVGGADVWATETLDVVISGAGDVEYYGDPSVHPEISGLGRLNGRGEK
ncbi:MAG: head GIN domain-containing protein [Anaerolineales bacterium]